MVDRILATPEVRWPKPDRTTFAAQPRNPTTVVLDGVTGAYNIGAIFRLCDAFLVERLVICRWQRGHVQLAERRHGGRHRAARTGAVPALAG